MSRKFLVPLVLPADPTAALEAATKQYVDARAGSEVEIAAADPIGTNPLAELWYDTTAVATGVTVASPGLVGYTKSGANVTVTTAATWVDHLSLTFNTIPGHTYRATATYYGQKLTAAGDVFVGIADSGNGQISNNGGTYAANAYICLVTEHIFTATVAVSYTLKARVFTSTNGAVFHGAGSALCFFVIQDITPATADGLATAWTPVTYQNGWSDKGGNEQPCQYRKIGDIVYLRGMMTRNPVPFATAAFNLPVGFRPPALVRPTPIVGNASYTLTLSRADITIQGDYLASAGNADSMWWPIDFQFSTTA